MNKVDDILHIAAQQTDVVAHTNIHICIITSMPLGYTKQQSESESKSLLKMTGSQTEGLSISCRAALSQIDLVHIPLNSPVY